MGAGNYSYRLIEIGKNVDTLMSADFTLTVGDVRQSVEATASRVELPTTPQYRGIFDGCGSHWIAGGGFPY
jgi:hypothetical protein